MFDRESPGADLSDEGRWFVYLLATVDCTAFKVGFTCNPLQRLYSFSHRYFEHLDLARSRLLQVDSNLDARAMERALKQELAAQRIDCPSWVLPQAGGDTEWFSPVYFSDAEARLHSLSSASVLILEAFVHDALARASTYFESWAIAQAGSILRPRSVREQPDIAAEIRTLRDWLDAYRALGVEVFRDDPDARILLRGIATQSPL